MGKKPHHRKAFRYRLFLSFRFSRFDVSPFHSRFTVFCTWFVRPTVRRSAVATSRRMSGDYKSGLMVVNLGLFVSPCWFVCLLVSEAAKAALPLRYHFPSMNLR